MGIFVSKSTNVEPIDYDYVIEPNGEISFIINGEKINKTILEEKIKIIDEEKKRLDNIFEKQREMKKRRLNYSQKD